MNFFLVATSRFVCLFILSSHLFFNDSNVVICFVFFFFLDFSHSFLCLSQTKYDINIYIHIKEKKSTFDHLVFLLDQNERVVLTWEKSKESIWRNFMQWETSQWLENAFHFYSFQISLEHLHCSRSGNAQVIGYSISSWCFRRTLFW